MRRSARRRGLAAVSGPAAPRRPHDPTGLNGTIIRIDPETGAGWPTNPDHASNDENEQRIVAFGFRNPFRFTTDPKTQKVYVANVGGSQFEEIDRFDPSAGSLYNSGWPCYEGAGREYQFKNLELPLCEDLYAETEEGGPGAAAEPFFYYSHRQTVAPGDECSYTSGSAISGLAFYEGRNSRPNTRARSSSPTRCGTASTRCCPGPTATPTRTRSSRS